jgi:O-acetyl-ADP-ribose deacetylase (regulator of RNase III)
MVLLKDITMIEYKMGDILQENVEALINTVNCVGIMGRGIALQFKKKFPENFKAYAAACKKEKVRPGRMFVFKTGLLHNPQYIINFPTKRHWRGKSRMEDIETGLADLIETIRQHDIKSVALPPLGGGLGGLPWPAVRSRIETAMQQLPDVKVVVFDPAGAPTDDTMAHCREVPKMTEGRAALVGLMAHYLRGLLDPMVSLLEVHKLMYFMQAAGQPLRLHYQKAIYGPYAENLRHVLNAIEGHLISGYADGGDSPGKLLSLVPGAFEEAWKYLQQHPETLKRFDRVSDLVGGFESSFGLELLSTVHWVASEEGASTLDKVIHKTYAWNQHKKQFTERQIKLALDVLNEKGWVN